MSLAAIMAASFQVPYALDFLAGTLLGLSVIFYWEICSLLCGLSESKINGDVDTTKVLATTAIYPVGITFLFFYGYGLFAMFALPWVIFMIYTNAMALLVKYEVVTIRNKDD